MLKPKIQYFGYLMRSQLTGKYLMLGKIKVKRSRERQRMRCLDSITSSMDMHFNKLWETV